MKIRTAALALALSCGGAFAQSSVTVYGVMDMSVGQTRSGTGVTLPGGTVMSPSGTVSRMESGVGVGSRLGFRGIEDLGGGLRSNFVLEMGIAANSGAFNQGGLPFGRQALVGLGGERWSLSLGRQYSPMDLALVTSEALGGGYWGNIANEAVGTYESIGSTPGNGSFQSNARVDNSALFKYSLNAWTGSLMVGTGNGSSRQTGRSVQGSVTYASGPFNMAAAYARIRQNAEQISPTAIPEWMNQWMVGGSYDFKTAKVYAGLFEGNGPANPANLSAAATLGAVGANSQAFSWTKNRIAWLAGRVPVGRDAVIFQIARESYPYRAMATGSSTIVAAVYEHVLSPRTLLYANYGQVTNNSTARTPLFSAIPVVATSFGGSPRALALGIRHSF